MGDGEFVVSEKYNYFVNKVYFPLLNPSVPLSRWRKRVRTTKETKKIKRKVTEK